MLSNKAASLPLSELAANRFKGYKQLKNNFEERGRNQPRAEFKTTGILKHREGNIDTQSDQMMPPKNLV